MTIEEAFPGKALPSPSPSVGAAPPANPGAPAPAGVPNMGGTGGGVSMKPVQGQPVAPGNPNQGQDSPVMKTKPLPVSQFQTATKPPDIPLEPLQQPNTHVTIEYMLEQMARVLEELAEKQEDPVWVTTHIQLAEAWRAGVEMLLNHAVQGQQTLGDAHLKQQQMDQQHDLHMQTLSHNDQQHFQGVKQADDQHNQKLKQNDELHQKNLKNQDVMNQQKVKQGDDQHKVNLAVTKQKGDLAIQQQKARASQQAADRKKPSAK